MPLFQDDDLALASFARYPLWPVRILRSVAEKSGRFKYQVFCYGSHEVEMVLEQNLKNFESNKTEAMKKVGKGVKGAFEELALSPLVYKNLATSSDTTGLIERTLKDVAVTKENMKQAIAQKVNEALKIHPSTTPSAAEIEKIIGVVHDAIILEFTPRFDRIEKDLKICQNQLELLENRVARVEAKLDDADQELRLDTLLFNGVKQPPGVEVKDATMNIIRNKMAFSGLADSDVISVHRFRLNSVDSRSDKIAPVLVKFKDRHTAVKVFACKKNLVNTKIFVAENLTKKKRELLNAAREKYGNKFVWSNQGRIYVRPENATSARRLWSLNDIFDRD